MSPLGATTMCGVRYREITNEDGTIERWQQPELADWEVPRTDPAERRQAQSGGEGCTAAVARASTRCARSRASGGRGTN
jgi:hypothetical protein